MSVKRMTASPLFSDDLPAALERQLWGNLQHSSIAAYRPVSADSGRAATSGIFVRFGPNIVEKAARQAVSCNIRAQKSLPAVLYY
jgi:hypothetical protein